MVSTGQRLPGMDCLLPQRERHRQQFAIWQSASSSSASSGSESCLMAATNSSGAVTGKMISPQNIAVGVTTVNLVGKEGEVLREIFWHSMAFAVVLSLLAFAQAYIWQWMVP